MSSRAEFIQLLQTLEGCIATRQFEAAAEAVVGMENLLGRVVHEAEPAEACDLLQEAASAVERLANLARSERAQIAVERSAVFLTRAYYSADRPAAPTVRLHG